jgi:hypothetical protein
MSRFRTEHWPIKNKLSLQYKDSVLCLGSCFAEEMGKKFIYHRVQSSINPCGIAYNPMSILEHCLNTWNELDLIFHDDFYHSLKHHSKFSSNTKETLIQKLNQAQHSLENKLYSSRLILVSFGSAYYYQFVDTQRIAANCHRVSQKRFVKKRLDIDQIIQSWDDFLTELFKIDAHKFIIFTVSPVRHLRDGLEENTKSKAILQLAIDQIIQKHSRTSYFPSYEIMIDDLRDYRFYGRDLLHPSAEAVDYIWEKFVHTYLDKSFQSFLGDAAKLKSFEEHVPRYSKPSEYENKVKQLQKNFYSKYPEISNKDE